MKKHFLVDPTHHIEGMAFCCARQKMVQKFDLQKKS
jgi:hypothetical protein